MYDYTCRSAFKDIQVFSHSKCEPRISSHVSFLLLFLPVRALFLDEPTLSSSPIERYAKWMGTDHCGCMGAKAGRNKWAQCVLEDWYQQLTHFLSTF